MFRILTPHYRVHCVWELTPERLRLWGLQALLLDVDCTLSRYHSEALPEAALWIEQIRAAGFKMCLVSNGLGERIEAFAARVNLPVVFKAMKPLPRGIRRAITMIDAEPSQTAMVGDQVFADVMAGRLAGVRTILVDPIHPEEEPWFTRLKRGPEKIVLARQEG